MRDVIDIRKEVNECRVCGRKGAGQEHGSLLTQGHDEPIYYCTHGNQFVPRIKK